MYCLPRRPTRFGVARRTCWRPRGNLDVLVPAAEDTRDGKNVRSPYPYFLRVVERLAAEGLAGRSAAKAGDTLSTLPPSLKFPLVYYKSEPLPPDNDAEKDKSVWWIRERLAAGQASRADRLASPASREMA